MYTDKNYQSKAELKRDVASGKKVTIYAPGLGTPVVNGKETVCGPHFPAPHRWYAEVIMKDGVIEKVK